MLPEKQGYRELSFSSDRARLGEGWVFRVAARRVSGIEDAGVHQELVGAGRGFHRNGVRRGFMVDLVYSEKSIEIRVI